MVTDSASLSQLTDPVSYIDQFNFYADSFLIGHLRNTEDSSLYSALIDIVFLLLMSTFRILE